MSVSIEDLRPKNFKIDVKGVEVECKPLRLSHTLIIAKIGNVFEDTTNASTEKIKQAEKDMDEVIDELIPELKGIPLDIQAIISIIKQMMETVEPTDNKEIREKGVKLDTDPKVPKIG